MVINEAGEKVDSLPMDPDPLDTKVRKSGWLPLFQGEKRHAHVLPFFRLQARCGAEVFYKLNIRPVCFHKDGDKGGCTIWERFCWRMTRRGSAAL